MIKTKKYLSFVIVFVLVFVTIAVPSKIAIANEGTSYSAMLERAEKIVNYEWTPKERIYTWNDNEYKGKNYFEAGEKVVGMPYTLFSWELGFDSLLSLEQYKSKADKNYSTSAYCNSVHDNRIGPAYGNCCATFVSEVFGGLFISGPNPRYDGVGGIESSMYSTCYTKVKVDSIQKGDAISNTKGSHIIWVGDVTDKTITIYESTPPICQKVVLNKLECTNSDGYLVYEKNVYNIVSKSNEIIRDDLSSKATLSTTIKAPLHAYTMTTEKTIVYDDINGKPLSNKIYSTDLCFIDAVFENGWCHVNFPLDAGGVENGYVETAVFFDANYKNSIDFSKSNLTIYSRNDLSERIGQVNTGKIQSIVGESDTAYEVLYESSSGGNELGWINKDDIYKLDEDNILDELCPIKGYPCVDKTFEVKKADYTSRAGEIYTTDYCTINSVFDDGWCQVTFPLNSGGTITGYTPISNFIFDTEYKSFEYVTTEEIDVYTDVSLSKYQNWWTGEGDTIYILSHIGNSYQICYPIDEKYGGGYKLGWIPTDSITMVEKQLESISLESLPNKVDYLIGEEFSADGISLKLNYNDGTTDVITNGFEILGFDSTVVGQKEIAISYDGFTVDLYVNIINEIIRDEESNVGDVDSDGEITDWDAIQLERYLAGWKVEINIDSSDIDKDGEITDWDAILLNRYLAGWNITLN